QRRPFDRRGESQQHLYPAENPASTPRPFLVHRDHPPLPNPRGHPGGGHQRPGPRAAQPRAPPPRPGPPGPVVACPPWLSQEAAPAPAYDQLVGLIRTSPRSSVLPDSTLNSLFMLNRPSVGREPIRKNVAPGIRLGKVRRPWASLRSLK